MRPVALATCDIDAAFVQGRFPVGDPFSFGHECVGEVTEVGDSVRSVKPGDLVSIPFQVSCGECAALPRRANRVTASPFRGCRRTACRWGRRPTAALRATRSTSPMRTRCSSRSPTASSRRPSRASPTTSPTHGGALRRPLEARPGSPVLIAMGAGSIALYSVAIALALGAERVDVVGGRQRDRELAEKLGANVLDEEFPDRAGFYPITVDASADPAGIACALRSTDADGICTSIGIYFEPTPLPLLDMFTQGDHLRHGAAARPHADAGRARAGPPGQVRPRPDDGRTGWTGRTPPRRSRTCARRPW